jgi:hypothetical protein
MLILTRKPGQILAIAAAGRLEKNPAVSPGTRC